MTKGLRIHWLSYVAPFLLAALLLLAGITVFELGNKPLGMKLGLAGLVVAIPSYVLSKMEDRYSRARIRKLSQMMDQLCLVPTSADKYSWLDRVELENCSTDLEGLRFACLGDFTIGVGGDAQDDSLELEQSFTRLFAQEQHRCFAEVCQSVRPRTGLTDMTCCIATHFTSGQQCRTSNGKVAPSPAVDQLREFGVFSASVPGASAQELLQLHAEQRDKLIADFGWTVADSLTFEAYQQHLADQMRTLRNSISDKLQCLGN